MAKYLFEVSYTLDGIKRVHATGGTARNEVARIAIESAGGTLDAYYFAFGASDVYVLADLPDNVAAASVTLTVAAGGGASVKTVVLLTPEEIDQASAKKVTYSAPVG